MTDISRAAQVARLGGDVVSVKDFGAVGDGVTDDTAAIQAADTAAASDKVVVDFPAGDYLVASKITKASHTVWRGVGNNPSVGVGGSLITTKVNGSCIEVLGDSTNRRGVIEGIRFLNDSTSTYPLAIALDFINDVRDHKITDCYIGNYDYGIKAVSSKALYIEKCYVFGALTDGIELDSCTDCWVIETQTQGVRYGINLHDGAGNQVLNSRPQVSGVANLRADNESYLKWMGGFSDTGISATGSGGKGGIISNCLTWSINGVTFYANGDDTSHLYIDATTADLCLDGSVLGCTFKQSSSNTGTIIGIEFGTCVGTLKRVSIDSNNLHDLDTSLKFNTVVGTLSDITLGASNIYGTSDIVSPDEVATNLRIEGAQGKETYKSYSAQSIDVVLDSNYANVQRFTGTMNTVFNLDLPTKGNYAGRKINVVRKDGGTGTINIRYNGSTVAHQLTGGSQWVELVAIGTGSTWVPTASDDLTR